MSFRVERLKDVPVDLAAIELKRKRRLLFLEYLMANGLDEKNIVNVLEVCNKIEDSLSIILPKERYSPFLLSMDSDQESFRQYGVYGLQDSEKNPIGDYSIFKDLDIAIAMGLTGYKRWVMYEMQGIPKFFGDCVYYKDSKAKKYYDSIHLESLDLMNEKSPEEYILVNDTIEREDLGFYLIKRKK
jgi:hypothetical protein